MYRIIIDNQSLINDVSDRDSFTYKIVEDCIGKKLLAVLSPSLKEEAESMANETIEETETFDLLDEYYKVSEEIESHGKAKIVDDKKTNELVGVAEAGDADFLITENSELLDIDEYKGIQIVTPEQFWNMYQEDNDGASEDNWGIDQEG